MSSISIHPRMGLNIDELAVLHSHANGHSIDEMSRALNLTPPDIKLIEQDIRFKLDAKTPMHMISRAFQLGILRVLCLAVCLGSFTPIDDQAVRTRSRTEMARTTRTVRQEITC